MSCFCPIGSLYAQECYGGVGPVGQPSRCALNMSGPIGAKIGYYTDHCSESLVFVVAFPGVWPFCPLPCFPCCLAIVRHVLANMVAIQQIQSRTTI